MTTQSHLDEMINKARAALYAINPDYAPDYLPPKPQIDASALKQFDWTGFTPSGHIHTCAICSQPLTFSFGSGRPSIYCSDACKMKAYRKRKALRNAHNSTAENSAGFVLTFGVNKSVFGEERDDRNDDPKTQSVGSVCNTHTKVWKPILNDNNKAAL